MKECKRVKVKEVFEDLSKKPDLQDMKIKLLSEKITDLNQGFNEQLQVSEISVGQAIDTLIKAGFKLELNFTK